MDPISHPKQHLTKTLPGKAAELLQRLRKERPRVHALTNTAAQVLTANLLLAAGAIPSLTIAPEEVAAFSGMSKALLVNLGTLDDDRRAAFPIAIRTMQAKERPWVLDPVFVESSPSRLDTALNLLAEKPTVLRCNATEFMAITGLPDASANHIRRYATEHDLTIAVTGASDIVSDGQRVISTHNGHPLMARTTAMGCAGTALIAAFCSLAEDPFEAAAAALVILGIVGEITGKKVAGPGTFPASFIDELYNVDLQIIEKRAELS